ncbi:MAG: serine/threonine-protein kinase, partial [Verrucomicrobiota bacterium]
MNSTDNNHSSEPSPTNLLQPGRIFGQYRIVRLLGRGGMGEVYEVEHKVLKRRFAMKVLPEDFGSRPEALARFQLEAEVMAGLDHPNIARVDDFGETESRYWLRMELAHGLRVDQTLCMSLEDYAEEVEGRIPARRLLSILKQVAEGLEYAHRYHAVHRDLKPSNILLFDGGAKITDFGLVKVMGEDWLRSQVEKSMKLTMSLGDQATEPGERTSTRSMLGTYEYMSPEQKRSEEADPRSDIFSLGVMTYRLLTGRGLGVKLPSQIVKGLPEAWDRLVVDATEEERKDRIRDGEQFLARLKEIDERSVDSVTPSVLPPRPVEQRPAVRANRLPPSSVQHRPVAGVKRPPPKPVEQPWKNQKILAPKKRHPALLALSLVWGVVVLVTMYVSLQRVYETKPPEPTFADWTTDDLARPFEPVAATSIVRQAAEGELD